MAALPTASRMLRIRGAATENEGDAIGVPAPPFERDRRPVISLIIAAVIPILLFGAWAAYRAAERERVAAHRSARDTVIRVVDQIEAELATQVQVAQALSFSEALEEPTLGGFYREAKRLIEARPLWHTIELTDPSGAQVLNLLRPFGAPLGPTADHKSFLKVVSTGRPVVGGIGPVGSVSGRRLVAIRVPVRRNDELRYVLTVALAPESVSQILREAGTPPDWIGVVLDGEGEVIARTVAEASRQARPASADAREAAARAPEGFYRGRTLEGTEVDTFYRALPNTSGWSVHLGAPTDVLNGPIRRALLLLGTGIAASLGLAGTLAGLLARDAAQRRREEQLLAAAVLERTEERASMAVEAANLGTWRWDFQRGLVSLSERCRELLDLRRRSRNIAESSRSAEEVFGAIHPDSRTAFQEAIKSCVHDREPLDLEFRTIGTNVPSRWLRVTGRARVAADEQIGVDGVMMDIQDRKSSEAERRRLLRRLADAQEQVQRRIARELHDQVGQSVTGLSMGLKSLERSFDTRRAHEAILDQISWLQQLASEIGREVHRAAADLRPAALDDLGLQKAVSAMGADWSRHYGMNIDLQLIGDEERLPSELETVAYRTIQEALTNVLKHANAKNIGIVLEHRSNELRIIIEDDGVGFDPDRILAELGNHEAHHRLGLSGIRERLALVGGTMTLESAPGSGTTLFVAVPVGSRNEEP
jgi:signal transduction histidine kinase